MHRVAQSVAVERNLCPAHIGIAEGFDAGEIADGFSLLVPQRVIDTGGMRVAMNGKHQTAEMGGFMA